MRQWQSAQRVRKFRRALLLSLLAVLLAGCQRSEPLACLQTYIDNLIKPLAAAPPVISSLHTLTPPTAAELLLPWAGHPLQGIDLLSLSGCDVQATIGKFDSSLGRAAKASQRLILALEYLRLTPACVQQLQATGDTTAAEQLQTSWQAQKDRLPVLIFNATLGSDEYRAFWLANPAPGDYPQSSFVATHSALRQIDRDVRRWLAGDYRAQNRNFELLLSEVAGGDGGARLHALSSACARRDFQERDTAPAQGYLDYLRAISALEKQLNTVLPQRYVQWRELRNRLFENPEINAITTCECLTQRQTKCPVQDYSAGAPSAGKLVTLQHLYQSGFHR